MTFVPDTFADGPAGATPITATKLNNVETGVAQVYSAWATYTPTVTGITLGNGTVLGRYRLVGKTVNGIIEFTWGTTSSMVGFPTFTLAPVNAPLNATGGRPAKVVFFNAGNNYFIGGCVLTSSAVAVAGIPANTTGALTALTATTPFTWHAGDKVIIDFMYEIS
jgi:hypothetical protein